MSNNVNMNISENTHHQQMQDMCKQHHNHLVQFECTDGQLYEGIIESMDNDHVNLLMPIGDMEMDEKRQYGGYLYGQPYGQQYGHPYGQQYGPSYGPPYGGGSYGPPYGQQPYGHPYGYPRRFRRFRRLRFPYNTLSRLLLPLFY